MINNTEALSRYFRIRFLRKKNRQVLRTAAKKLIFFLSPGSISYAAGGSV